MLSGLPPELAELLERLRRRGIPVTALELGRLRHLLAGTDAPCTGELPVLLAALLCKDELQRGALQREYRRWAAEHETLLGDAGAVPAPDAALPGTALPGAGGARPGADPGAAEPARGGTAGRLRAWLPSGPAAWLIGLLGRLLGGGRALWRAHPRLGLVGVLLLACAALLLCRLACWPEPPPAPLLPTPAPVAEASGGLADGLCPTDLPTEPVPEVWAWVPVPDPRPWPLLGAGLLLLALAAVAARRLWRGPPGWGPAPSTAADDRPAPLHALPPLEHPGDLLLAAPARRALVWSVDRYVGEQPDTALDPDATVAATARAAGAPQLLRRRLSFPREVWLWRDRHSADPALQDRLLLELTRALTEANLPVRCARFDGLPERLIWDESREPFAPDHRDAAGAAAIVAVLTDGAALLRAWDSPGRRERVERLLALLRPWPRLCLVDLGDGALTRLARAEGWPLAVRRAADLADWLAQPLPGGPAERPGVAPADAGALDESAPDAAAGQARIDLWAAACLLPAGRGADPLEAEALRQSMRLPLPADAAPRLTARLAEARADPALRGRLLAHLARDQHRDRRQAAVGDTWLLRALAFWEQRLEAGRAALPADDPAARDDLARELGLLALWRDPAAAADLLGALRGPRNRNQIRADLADIRPEDPGGPLPHWRTLPVRVRYRLRALGLGGRSGGGARLRRGLHHHLALALLTGLAVAAGGWGLQRVLAPGRGAADAFDDPRFTARVIAEFGSGAAWGRTWLGSPWRLTALAHTGPLATPHTWAWQSAPNPLRVGEQGAVLGSGSRAFPIRPCVPGWPRRALAVIAAPYADADARRLALRLLDRGSADRVLLAPDWPAHLAALTQGARLPDDQWLIFTGAEPPASLPGSLGDAPGGLALIPGAPAALAVRLDFPGARPVGQVWPGADVRAGRPRAVGGPEVQTDARGITWVRVCGGTFAMGSPPSEDAHIDTYAREWADAGGGELEQLRDDWRGWLARERPRHPVLLDDFWMARTELTPAQAGRGDGDLPLVDIDWAGARDACAAVGGRLPTEAEWEYAARAGSAERWSFGDDPAALGDHAWYRDNADYKAHPVGRRQPNGLCLADLHGNVYEWVADCYDAGAYAGRAPLAIDPLAAPSACERRVVRGGAFLDPPGLLRSALRDVFGPVDRFGVLGLRCVRSGARQP